jgi:hypothetical protein
MSKEIEEKIFAPSCELHFAADRPLIGVSGSGDWIEVKNPESPAAIRHKEWRR